jgi:predicted ATP-dependent serine protease
MEGHEQLKLYITNHCKNLFGASDEGNFHMYESRTNNICHVLDEENVFLTTPYIEEEVTRAIIQWNTIRPRNRMHS